MPERDQLARRMVRRTACFDADKAARGSLEKRQHLRTSQRLANYNIARHTYSVNLKNVLGQIEANRGNLHLGWLLSYARERL